MNGKIRRAVSLGVSAALLLGLLSLSALAAPTSSELAFGQTWKGVTWEDVWKCPADGSPVPCPCKEHGPGACLPAGIYVSVHDGSLDPMDREDCGDHSHGDELYPVTVNGVDGVWPGIFFLDMSVDRYYSLPVMWAVLHGLTTGTGDGTTFSPDWTCSRAEILTMLHRAMGRPAVEENRLRDVAQESYFCSAANWALEQELVSGNVFAGDTPCTRMDVVRYLWQLAGSPGAKMPAGFADLPADAAGAAAVAWAVERGITTGTGDGTTFTPDGVCTRAEIVTFLFRAYALGR